MTYFFVYWLPPILWMAFLFPMTNDSLTVESTSYILEPIIRWFFPGASNATVWMIHIVIRKAGHFIEYSLLAFLLFRAFRGKSKTMQIRWILYAGGIAVSYGALDEFLQTMTPLRSGEVYDWMIDTAGVVVALGMISHQGNNSREPLLKRPFDIFLSFTGLIFSLPLWFLFGLLITIEDGWPIFYTQERVGRNGRIFKAIKFRSMIGDAERDTGPVQSMEHDPRVTRTGRIMRATAMDELPQLFNILKGDMSFVGPRALRPKEREVYGTHEESDIEDIPGYQERLAVRPGLTGVAQVYLPTDALRKAKFQYDIEYIRNQSFLFDLKLIFLSFWITFRGKWESREKKV
jgi:lipopolysaccharide/colanic/teichoic acid biosynthesis glycosyltransferase